MNPPKLWCVCSLKLQQTVEEMVSNARDEAENRAKARARDGSLFGRTSFEAMNAATPKVSGRASAAEVLEEERRKREARCASCWLMSSSMV